SAGQGRHDMQTIAQNETVRPIDVVLVELNCLTVLLLWVTEQGSLYVLPSRDFQNGLRGNPLVDVHGNRINFESRSLRPPLAGPLQPRLLRPKGLGQQAGLLIGELAADCLGQQFGQLVVLAGGVEPQGRRTTWAVGVLDLGYYRDSALGSDL